MPNVRFTYFPGGRRKALTLSYDDGVKEDKQLVTIMNRHGIKGSFHLNSNQVMGSGPSHVRADEAREVYAGHEISVHSVTHPDLRQVPRESLISEIWEDRRALEKVAGYPVRGMSYPFGTVNDTIVNALRELGVVCSRTVAATGGFGMPDDWLRWHPTCHHNRDLLATTDRFIAFDPRWNLALFFVWGHSYEFPKDDNWAMIEEFCEKIGRRDDIWYATNIEIHDYMTALTRLEFSADRSVVHNPLARSLWLGVDGRCVEVSGGATLRLDA